MQHSLLFAPHAVLSCTPKLHLSLLLQVGMHTVLAMPSTQAASASIQDYIISPNHEASQARLKVVQKIKVQMSMCCRTHTDVVLHTTKMPIFYSASTCIYHARTYLFSVSCLFIDVTLQVQDVSESLMFGWPMVLLPYGDSFDSLSDMQANEHKLAALCQV